MGAIILAVAISLLIYVVAVSLIPSHILQGSNNYTRHMLDRLQKENAERQGRALPEAAAVRQDPTDNPLVRAFLLLPGMQRSVPAIQRAGLWRNLDAFMLAMMIVYLAILAVLSRFGGVAIIIALMLTYLCGYTFVTQRIRRRGRAFMNQFADALDSIIRSIKAGYPLNSAIALVGESTRGPLGAEFRRVADETAYGWTLHESLDRLADRIDEPDIRFFAVVLSVQHESGGNLAEVLGNLSSVVRKRKQLRLKIRALSSEGRATAWILGSLPVGVFAIIYFIAPDHLQPLFNTHTGNMIIAGVGGLIATGMLIVRQMIEVDI